MNRRPWRAVEAGRLVPARGFEPRTLGLKGRCSATELHRHGGRLTIMPATARGGTAAGSDRRTGGQSDGGGVAGAPLVGPGHLHPGAVGCETAATRRPRLAAT